MNTTYIFGAGASRAVGYPLASEMGAALLDFMQKSPDMWIRASGEFLIDSFGKSPNVEDLITEIQSRVDRLRNAPTSEERVQRSKLANSRGFLGTALREWFREIHMHPAPSYATFAEKVVHPGDVIITFNYDDSLERELKRAGKWDISQGYGFPFSSMEHSSDVLVLKLHGSVNWLVSVLGGATGGAFILNPASTLGDRPVIHRADLDFLGYEKFSGHTYESGGAYPCLILPGRTKTFFYDTSFGHEYTEFWDHLWSQATSAVKRCDKIVLCGYNLLSVDQRACELLLKRPSKETPIEVVSGNQSERIANDFIAAGFTNVEVFRDGYFENWCKLKCS